jgi:hypothetical protein
LAVLKDCDGQECEEREGCKMVKSSLLMLPLSTLIIVTMLLYSPYAASSYHPHEHTKCTQLYVYTYPVEKEPCIVFKHPSGHELEKANRANIEFNKGVEAGHLKTLTFNSTSQLNCPSGNSIEFCSGWKSATQFTFQQYKAGLTARASSHHDNNTVTNAGR